MFGKSRSTQTKFGLLAASAEAQTLAGRRRSLIARHSRGKRAARGKRLHAALLAHPLCWSNRVIAPQPKALAAEMPREPAHARAEPQVEAHDDAPVHAPHAAVPHHAQRPMYAQVSTWNTYLPWATPGISRTHGPHLHNDQD